jgi:NADPH:quinone reductase-like Zn-dependent oxidoreductase
LNKLINISNRTTSSFKREHNTLGFLLLFLGKKNSFCVLEHLILCNLHIQSKSQNMSQKTVLITGTSSGIGHSLARLLNAKGFKVLATARKTESISDLTALGITALALDVDKPESIAALKVEVEKITGGKLDILINNAGMYTTPLTLSKVTRHRN